MSYDFSPLERFTIVQPQINYKNYATDTHTGSVRESLEG